MAKKTTLQTICEKYCNIAHNEQNYSIGGGLSSDKFASKRHEDAKSDWGKLTLGEATKLFKKATGYTTDQVRDVLHYAIPRMEWHHAGKLPKSYGGGMKKTYFINAEEICQVATNWNTIVIDWNASKNSEKEKELLRQTLEEKKQNFLIQNAKKVERVLECPENFYKILSECNGKYGWFDASKNIYRLPEYHTGWAFQTKELLDEFLNIK